MQHPDVAQRPGVQISWNCLRNWPLCIPRIPCRAPTSPCSLSLSGFCMPFSCLFLSTPFPSGTEAVKGDMGENINFPKHRCIILSKSGWKSWNAPPSQYFVFVQRHRSFHTRRKHVGFVHQMVCQFGEIRRTWVAWCFAMEGLSVFYFNGQGVSINLLI